MGKEKSIKQIKDKLRNLKDLYNQAKYNNKNGKPPVFSPDCQDFDEILGTIRDVISLQRSREVGVAKKI